MVLLKHPEWQLRIFPLTTPEMQLDDEDVIFYEQYWQQEAQRLQNLGGSETEVAVAKEVAKNIGHFLRWAREAEPLDMSTDVKSTMVLMLARQEILDKKEDKNNALVQLPLRRNRYFSGREDEMRRINEKLQLNNYCAIVNKRPGGIGKSSLALEYAYRNQDKYDLIVWIQWEQMEVDLKKLGKALGLDDKHLTDENVVTMVREEVSKRKKSLLIFDDVQRTKQLEDFLENLNGHALITSRDCNWKNAMKVDAMPKEDALRYVQRVTGIIGQEDKKKLVEKLESCPLALTLAAAYIKRQKIDVATYLEIFEKNQKSFSENDVGYPRSVATACAINICKAEEENANAANILIFCCFLAPNNIPDSALREWLRKLTKLEPGLGLDEALRILESYSLIATSVEQTGGMPKRSVCIHELIQSAARDRISQEKKSLLMDSTLNFFSRKINKDNECADLVKHGNAALSHAEQQKFYTISTTALARALGCYFFECQKFVDAKDSLESFLRILKARYSNENQEEIALAYAYIGYTMEELKCPDQAEIAMEKAIGIYENLGVKNDELILWYNHIGKIYYSKKDIQRAFDKFQQAVRCTVELKGENDPSLAELYNNMASVYLREKCFGDAKVMYSKAVALETNSPLRDNKRLASYYTNLAIVMTRLKQYSVAAQFFNTAENLNP